MPLGVLYLLKASFAYPGFPQAGCSRARAPYLLDELLLALAAELEGAAPWADRWPPAVPAAAAACMGVAA